MSVNVVVVMICKLLSCSQHQQKLFFFLQHLSDSNKAYPDKSSRYQSVSKILSKATNFTLIFVVVVAFI